MSAALFLGLLGLTAPLAAATASTPGLELAYSLERATQGISISSDGRKFLSQRYSTTLPPQIVELLDDNSTVLYPNAAWNSYNSSDPTSDPRKTFVSIDGARMGPDGRYWIVDGGSTGVNGSTKLVGVNLTTDAVDKLYYLDAMKASDSGIDDVRFNAAGDVAYMSDTAGALLVMNMTTGTGVRVLSTDSSAQPWFPMMYNGTLVPGYGAAGSTLSVGLDQIEVSPDGVYLYYQPCNGGLYRIKTAYVDASLKNATLASTLGDYAEPFALTPSTGGSIIQDEKLLWTDLMWVTADKKLWLPD